MVIFNSYVNVYQMISHGGTPVAKMVSMENPRVCGCNPSEKYEFVS